MIGLRSRLLNAADALGVELLRAAKEHDPTLTSLVLTAFPMGQLPESYERLRGIAERVGARWIEFSDLWEDITAYRRDGALSWSEHPSADTHRIFAERITGVVEELLSRE